MALPTRDELEIPVLTIIVQNPNIGIRELYKKMQDYFNLSRGDLEILTKNGREPRFIYDIRWILTILKNKELVERPSHAVYLATDKGVAFLEEITKSIFVEEGCSKEDPSEDEMNLDIFAEDYYQSVEEEILSRLKSMGETNADKGRFFEEKCLELLEKMGYGKGERTGGSGDRGIDGFLIRDPLGFERIGIQCKCYTDSKVDDNEITKFAHGLKNVHGCTQGVFLTTSDFLPRAKKAAEETKDIKIILIHGIKLAELMRKHQVGVKIKETKYIYDIDL